MISDKRPVRELLALMLVNNIRKVVICPGSRNAPFSVSLHNNPDFSAFIVPDERSAAFMALGMAQQDNRPVTLICTSGTAPLNFSPAIAEAFYQRIPLLIVTADRPVEWIDQGEGQSIRQRNVFQNIVKSSFEVMEETTHPDSAWYNNRIIDQAIRLCTEGVHGPVHINFPLREPLYQTSAEPLHIPKRIIPTPLQFSINEEVKSNLLEEINSAERVMILAGQYLPDSNLLKALTRWAQLPQVAVLTEAHSNLSGENLITTIDRLLMGLDKEELNRLMPEVLITFGHNIISRKIKAILRSGKIRHWHIDISGEGLDTFKGLCRTIAQAPSEFFQEIIPEPNERSKYSDDLLSLNLRRKNLAEHFLNRAAWSDLAAFNIIYKNLPANEHLQLGNSSVIRYILLLDARGDLLHFGNRGVAGIDGCTSTALGAAIASGEATTLIVGDIAFFYDSNAFWNDYIPNNLKIILINNQGGGIFRIIEGPDKSPALEAFFETRHNRNAKSFAAMYLLPYSQAASASQLVEGLDWLYKQSACAILEVNTPAETNAVVLKNYFDSLKI
jgi:2-succinyl-5-enolpyruvyl-6-hydroxy-3-cyclohexene-1-carboxylate synthase